MRRSVINLGFAVLATLSVVGLSGERAAAHHWGGCHRNCGGGQTNSNGTAGGSYTPQTNPTGGLTAINLAYFSDILRSSMEVRETMQHMRQVPLQELSVSKDTKVRQLGMRNNYTYVAAGVKVLTYGNTEPGELHVLFIDPYTNQMEDGWVANEAFTASEMRKISQH